MNTPTPVPVDLPSPAEGFAWERRGSAVALVPQTTHARAVFSTRAGGFCTAPWDTLNVSYAQGYGETPDWPDRVTENRRICSAFIDGSPHWTRVLQVHGVEVREAAHPAERKPPDGVNRDNPEADGLWTKDPSRTIAVSNGDCASILCVRAGRVAVAHAGWRGTLAGVVQAAALAISAEQVFIGPGIGPCCFSHTPEVVASFRRRFGDGVVRGGDHIDLWEASRLAAIEAGALDVYVAGLCTACNSNLFFSGRRDDRRTGRQALIARVP
ncbi:MAG: polyphenol oxidase family protein [Actinomycetota bacterium]